MPLPAATALMAAATQAAADTADVTSLVKHSLEDFPVLTANLDQNRDAWQNTWG